MRHSLKVLLFGVAALAATLFSSPSHATDPEPPPTLVCFPSGEVLAYLFVEGFLQVGQGMTQGKFVLELWDNQRDNRWMMLLRDTEGNLCPFAGGVAWEWETSLSH